MDVRELEAMSWLDTLMNGDVEDGVFELFGPDNSVPFAHEDGFYIKQDELEELLMLDHIKPNILDKIQRCYFCQQDFIPIICEDAFRAVACKKCANY